MPATTYIYNSEFITLEVGPLNKAAMALGSGATWVGQSYKDSKELHNELLNEVIISLYASPRL